VDNGRVGLGPTWAIACLAGNRQFAHWAQSGNRLTRC
jgi:hypothetical protein